MEKEPHFTRLIGFDEKYVSTAVLIPLVSLEGKDHLLFQKRSPHIPQGNEICFPGGKRDKNQDHDSRDTAIRETIEELGIARNKIHLLKFQGTLLAAMGVAVDAYVGRLEISSIEELQLQESEVQKVFTIPCQWFHQHPPEEYGVRLKVHPFLDLENGRTTLLPSRELGLPERYHQPWGYKDHPIYLYKTDFGVIWGITAELTRDFIQNSPQLPE